MRKQQFHLFMYRNQEAGGGCHDYEGNFDEYYLADEYARRTLTKRGALVDSYQIAIEDDLTGRLTVIKNG